MHPSAAAAETINCRSMSEQMYHLQKHTCGPDAPSITLVRSQNTYLKINLFGGVITSWVVDKQEQLFVSRKVVFNDKRSFRGGIKVIFPDLGYFPLGFSHGFAHLCKWKILQPPKTLKHFDVETIIGIKADLFTQSMWNYPFEIVYNIKLQVNKLRLRLEIKNTGSLPIKCHPCISVYLRTKNRDECKLSEFTHYPFYKLVDKTKNLICKSASNVFHSKKVSRVYVNVMKSENIGLYDEDKKVMIRSQTLPDLYFWYPNLLTDERNPKFDKDEPSKVLCLGPGYLHEHVTIPVNGSLKLDTDLSCTYGPDKDFSADSYFAENPKMKNGILIC